MAGAGQLDHRTARPVFFLVEFRLVRFEHSDFAPPVKKQRDGRHPQYHDAYDDEGFFGSYYDRTCDTTIFIVWIKKKKTVKKRPWSNLVRILELSFLRLYRQVNIFFFFFSFIFVMRRRDVQKPKKSWKNVQCKHRNGVSGGWMFKHTKIHVLAINNKQYFIALTPIGVGDVCSNIKSKNQNLYLNLTFF